MRFRVLCALFVCVFWLGCSAEPGGTQQDASAAGGCTVVENEDGSVAIKCADGSEVTLGKDEKCTAVDNDDGTVTIHITTQVTSLEQLSRLFTRIEGVRGVHSMARTAQPQASTSHAIRVGDPGR